MKIVLISGASVPGQCGVADYTVQLATALKRINVEAEIFSAEKWRLRDVSDINRILRSRDADIFHLQYPTSAYGHRLGPQALALRRRCIITLHEASQAHVLRKLSLYPFALRNEHLIFTSEYERQFARGWAPWIGSSSSVIPIGSNINPVCSTSPRNFDEVVYFGLIMPKKGLEQVLELARILKQEESKMSVRIIGKVPVGHRNYYERFRQEAQAGSVILDLELTHEQVAHRLSRAAIGYLPFPDGASERRASLKAMLSAGVGVITTPGKQTPSEMADAVMFAQTPRDVLQVIRYIRKNLGHLERLGQKSHEYIEQFNWSRIAKMHADVYTRILRLRSAEDRNAEVPLVAESHSLK